VVLAVAGELNGHHPRAEVIATLSAVSIFVAVYLWFWARLYHSGRPLLAVSALAVLCVIAVGLSLVSSDNFGGLLIYCATVAGSALHWRRSWLLVAAVCALTLLIAVVLPGDLIGRSAVALIALLAGVGISVDGHAALQASWDIGVRYFDTAPWYGRGQSELRVGRMLRQVPRHEFVLSTKVGRILRAPRGDLPFEVRFDYTYDGILRAYEDSLQRLGLTEADYRGERFRDWKPSRPICAPINRSTSARSISTVSPTPASTPAPPTINILLQTSAAASRRPSRTR